jgi:hypothetical protein
MACQPSFRNWCSCGGLQLGAPYEGANVSFVAPASRDDERLVLKVQWPHDECAHEADALTVMERCRRRPTGSTRSCKTCAAT